MTLEVNIKPTQDISQLPSLGVVAISYNEEKDMPGFIDNLFPWVDEIVIVDDGSIDMTEQIVEDAVEKVKFIKSPRKVGEYYSDQRNKGIAASGSDWLLHMDIDERVSPELAEEIRSLIVDKGKDAFRFRRLNFFLHKPMRGGGWQDWNMVHLARRKVLHFEGMFHEVCVLGSPEDKIGQLQNKMWHLNDDSYKSRMRKSFNYCQELSGRIKKRFNKIRWFHIICLPVFEFIRKYIFKAACRDGIRGLIFSMHSAGAMFRACALAWDEQNQTSRTDLENRMVDLWKQSDVLQKLNKKAMNNE